jgi:hypothetical protein
MHWTLSRETSATDFNFLFRRIEGKARDMTVAVRKERYKKILGN